MTYPPKDYYKSKEFRRRQKEFLVCFVILVVFTLAACIIGVYR